MASPELERVLSHLRDVAKRSQAAAIAQDMPRFREEVERFAAVSEETTAVSAKVSKVDAAGRPCEWVRAEGCRSDLRMLYIHGGGWMAGTIEGYRPLASRISKAAGCSVLTVDYRLAPEHRFPAGLEDCVAVYKWMVENGPEGKAPASHTFIAGDSAGGNLTFAALLMLRDEGAALPDGAIAISAATDFTASGESTKTRKAVDPIIDAGRIASTGKGYFGDKDPKDPLLSPLFGDLEGLPPLLIQVGDAETLLDDSVRIARKAKDAGVDTTLEVWPEMPHVWHVFAPLLPQAEAAIARIGAFVQARIGA